MGRANSKPRDVNPTLDYEIFGFTETGQDVNIPLSEFSKVLASEIASELGITGVPPGSVLVVSDSGDKLEQLLLSDSFEIVNENGVKTLKLVNSGCCNDSDTTKPVITLLGANSVSALQNTIYSDAGATAEDDVDGNITSAIVVGGDQVNTAVAGSYIITYNVSDAAGNAADEVVRYVSVVSVDNTAPDIILIGLNPINITEGDSYLEPGAIAFDAVDGDVSSNIVVDSSGLDVNTIGSYTVTYNVSDQAGNAANEVTRTVNVVAVVIPNPIQPISLTVSLVDEVNATFNWDTAGNDPAISYLLEYMPVGDLPDWSNATSVTTSANVTTYSMLIPDSDRGVSVARVTAVNSVGDLSLPSDVESYDSRDKTAPVHNGFISGGQDSNGLAALQWHEATDNVGVDHYELTYRVNGTDESTATTLNLGPGVLSQAVSVSDETWYFTIQAFDAAGNSSQKRSIQFEINNASAEAVTLSVDVSASGVANLTWNSLPANQGAIYRYHANSVSDLSAPTTSDWSSADFSTTGGFSGSFSSLSDGVYDFKVETLLGSSVDSNIVRKEVVDSTAVPPVYYGQIDTSSMSLLDLLNNNEPLAGPGENITYTLEEESISGSTTVNVPFLGTPLTNTGDQAKETHFILIPTGYTMTYSVNASNSGDIFYQPDPLKNEYNADTLGLPTSINYKGETYQVWTLKIDGFPIISQHNPLGSYVNVSLELV